MILWTIYRFIQYSPCLFASVLFANVNASYGLRNYTNCLFPLLVFLLFFFKFLIDKNVILIFWVTGPHTGRIVTQWRYYKQSKDWRGQTYPQPLLLRSKISLFWRTSCVRDFFLNSPIDLGDIISKIYLHFSGPIWQNVHRYSYSPEGIRFFLSFHARTLVLKETFIL